MLHEDYERVSSLLDATHQWPCTYTFKFIGQLEAIDDVIHIFSQKSKFVKKPSKTGKYYSLTVIQLINSSKEVIEYYKKVRERQPKLISI